MPNANKVYCKNCLFCIHRAADYADAECEMTVKDIGTFSYVTGDRVGRTFRPCSDVNTTGVCGKYEPYGTISCTSHVFKA
jgi:hypothetical protein